jgi:folate-dependent phosphoribosylglycinamide formyltransferase PurN
VKIGIVTSSDYNPYGAVLVHRLADMDRLPVCIISNEKTKAAKLGKRLRKGEYGAILRDAGYMLGRARPDGGAGGTSHLEQYARARGYDSWRASLSSIASKKGIAAGRFKDFNTNDAIKFVEDHRVDILINAGHGIFRKWIIAAPKLGILNAHMGILPAYRGMNVIEWSAFYGDPVGVTVHFIDRGIDTGDILLTRELPLEKGDDFALLRGRIQVLGIELLAECITLIEENRLLGKVQAKEDGKQYFVMHPRLAEIAQRRLDTRIGP